MIPPFDDHGYLPPGVHRATLAEVRERFGCENDLRTTQIQSLEWFVAIARRAGALRIVVNGSFVTDRYEPNDVNCAVLMGDDYDPDSEAARELQAGLPFISCEIGGVIAFEEYTSRYFASDRRMIEKGMLEVIDGN